MAAMDFACQQLAGKVASGKGVTLGTLWQAELQELVLVGAPWFSAVVSSVGC